MFGRSMGITLFVENSLRFYGYMLYMSLHTERINLTTTEETLDY